MLVNGISLFLIIALALLGITGVGLGISQIRHRVDQGELVGGSVMAGIGALLCVGAAHHVVLAVLG